MNVTIVAAMDITRGLGKDNQLLYRIPQDMKRFKALTQGKTVVMGRKTWESLPEKFRPLPNRDNFIISTNPKYDAPGAKVFTSLAAALAASETEDVCVIGGAQIYEQALAYAKVIEMTEIKCARPADTVMPTWDLNEYDRVVTFTGVHNEIGFEFVRYTLKQ